MLRKLGVGVSFNPHPLHRPAFPRQPIPSRADLEARREILWASSMEPSTRKAYQRAVKQWFDFCLATSPLSSLPNPDSLSLFVTWRLGINASCYSTLSGLAWYFRPRMGNIQWEAVRSSPEVLDAIRGGTKVKAHQKCQAEPFPHKLVEQAIKLGLDPLARYDTLLWSTMIVVLFFSCGRAAEVTESDTPAFRNCAKSMTRDQTHLSTDQFRTYLPYQKASPLYSGSWYHFVAADTGSNAFTLIRRYLTVRDHLHGRQGVLWRKFDGTPPTRRWFVDQLQRSFSRRWTGHSFRSGGASWYFLRGASDRDIQRLGRWKSKAFEDYIRLRPELSMAKRLRDISLLPSSQQPTHLAQLPFTAIHGLQKVGVFTSL
jgi:hypothetical protein